MKFENVVYKKYAQIETAEGTKYVMTLEKIEEARELKLTVKLETGSLRTTQDLEVTIGDLVDVEIKNPQTKLI